MSNHTYSKDQPPKVHAAVIAAKLALLATSLFTYLHNLTVTTPKENALGTLNALSNNIRQQTLHIAYTTKDSILPIIPEPAISLARTLLNILSLSIETAQAFAESARNTAVRKVEAVRRFGTETARDAMERTLMKATSVTNSVYTTVRDILHLADTIDTTKNVLENSAESIYHTASNYLQTVDSYKIRAVENVKGGVESVRAVAEDKFVKIEEHDRSQYVLRCSNDAVDRLFVVRDFLSRKVKSYTADVVHQKDHLVGKVHNVVEHVKSSIHLQGDKSGVRAA